MNTDPEKTAAEAKRLTNIRRKFMGNPSEVSSAAAKMLLVPGGKRERAARAVFKGAPNPSRKESLCNDLKDNMYRDELYDLAQELGLDVEKRITKSELCKRISDLLAHIPPVEGVSNDLSETYYHMARNLPLNLADFAQRYFDITNKNEALQRANEIKRDLDQNSNNQPFIRGELEDLIRRNITWPSWLDMGADKCFDCILEQMDENLVDQLIQAYRDDGGTNPVVLNAQTTD